MWPTEGPGQSSSSSSSWYQPGHSSESAAASNDWQSSSAAYYQSESDWYYNYNGYGYDNNQYASDSSEAYNVYYQNDYLNWNKKSDHDAAATVTAKATANQNELLDGLGLSIDSHTSSFIFSESQGSDHQNENVETPALTSSIKLNPKFFYYGEKNLDTESDSQKSKTQSYSSFAKKVELQRKAMNYKSQNPGSRTQKLDSNAVQYKNALTTAVDTSSSSASEDLNDKSIRLIEGIHKRNSNVGGNTDSDAANVNDSEQHHHHHHHHDKEGGDKKGLPEQTGDQHHHHHHHHTDEKDTSNVNLNKDTADAHEHHHHHHHHSDTAAEIQSTPAPKKIQPQSYQAEEIRTSAAESAPVTVPADAPQRTSNPPLKPSLITNIPSAPNSVAVKSQQTSQQSNGGPNTNTLSQNISNGNITSPASVRLNNMSNLNTNNINNNQYTPSQGNGTNGSITPSQLHSLLEQPPKAYSNLAKGPSFTSNFLSGNDGTAASGAQTTGKFKSADAWQNAWQKGKPYQTQSNINNAAQPIPNSDQLIATFGTLDQQQISDGHHHQMQQLHQQQFYTAKMQKQQLKGQNPNRTSAALQENPGSSSAQYPIEFLQDRNRLKQDQPSDLLIGSQNITESAHDEQMWIQNSGQIQQNQYQQNQQVQYADLAIPFDYADRPGGAMGVLTAGPVSSGIHDRSGYQAYNSNISSGPGPTQQTMLGYSSMSSSGVTSKLTSGPGNNVNVISRRKKVRSNNTTGTGLNKRGKRSKDSSVTLANSNTNITSKTQTSNLNSNDDEEEDSSEDESSEEDTGGDGPEIDQNLGQQGRGSGIKFHNAHEVKPEFHHIKSPNIRQLPRPEIINDNNGSNGSSKNFAHHNLEPFGKGCPDDVHGVDGHGGSGVQPISSFIDDGGEVDGDDALEPLNHDPHIYTRGNSIHKLPGSFDEQHQLPDWISQNKNQSIGNNVNEQKSGGSWDTMNIPVDYDSHGIAILPVHNGDPNNPLLNSQSDSGQGLNQSQSQSQIPGRHKRYGNKNAPTGTLEANHGTNVYVTHGDGNFPTKALARGQIRKAKKIQYSNGGTTYQEQQDSGLYIGSVGSNNGGVPGLIGSLTQREMMSNNLANQSQQNQTIQSFNSNNNPVSGQYSGPQSANLNIGSAIAQHHAIQQNEQHFQLQRSLQKKRERQQKLMQQMNSKLLQQQRNDPMFQADNELHQLQNQQDLENYEAGGPGPDNDFIDDDDIDVENGEWADAINRYRELRKQTRERKARRRMKKMMALLGGDQMGGGSGVTVDRLSIEELKEAGNWLYLERDYESASEFFTKAIMLYESRFYDSCPRDN